MYVTSFPSEIYHVLTSSKEVALCGHQVSPAEINVQLNKTFSLHHVYEKPSNHALCYHCAKVARRTAVLRVAVDAPLRDSLALEEPQHIDSHGILGHVGS